MLLQSEGVQKDLQLTTEQTEKVKDVLKNARESLRKQREAIRDLSTEERRTKMKEVRGKIEAGAKETREKIEAILTPKQKDRLKEIRLQVAGFRAFANAEVAKALNLTEEQREKVRKLGGKVADLTKGLRDLSPRERRAKMAELGEKLKTAREESLAEGMKVLTPEQREKFEKMQGKKLELKPGELPLQGNGPSFDLPARRSEQ